jgi:hypothetical protein
LTYGIAIVGRGKGARITVADIERIRAPVVPDATVPSVRTVEHLLRRKTDPTQKVGPFRPKPKRQSRARNCK